MNFWTKLTQKGYLQTKKNKNYRRILNIQIKVDYYFQLQQTILILGTNLKKKRIFLVENRKKMNTTIEFLIFKLV